MNTNNQVTVKLSEHISDTQDLGDLTVRITYEDSHLQVYGWRNNAENALLGEEEVEVAMIDLDEDADYLRFHTFEFSLTQEQIQTALSTFDSIYGEDVEYD